MHLILPNSFFFIDNFHLQILLSYNVEWRFQIYMVYELMKMIYSFIYHTDHLN